MVPAFGETKTLEVSVAAGKTDRANAPAVIAITLPESLAKNAKNVHLTGKDGTKIVGQITAPSLLATPAKAASGSTPCELHFIAPPMKAGETQAFQVTIADEPSTAPAFLWTDTPKKYNDLTFAGRPVLRYMYEPMDESTKERRSETFKVYHHVYDPKGTQLVTKGPGGLFHHRGLYFGFNRISYEVNGEKKVADTWHCNKGESQSHERFLASEAGPVLGRHRLAIDWHGQDGESLRHRTAPKMTAYNTTGGTLIEFVSRLTSVARARVKLNAAIRSTRVSNSGLLGPNCRDKTATNRRPDGPDKPGSFRNWPNNQKNTSILAWNALSFVLENNVSPVATWIGHKIQGNRGSANGTMDVSVRTSNSKSTPTNRSI